MGVWGGGLTSWAGGLVGGSGFGGGIAGGLICGYKIGSETGDLLVCERIGAVDIMMVDGKLDELVK